MQFQSEHIAASSSPMYGGGLRWGANDLAPERIEVGANDLAPERIEVGANDLICALSPIPAFPRKAGEGDAATCRFLTNIEQRLPPPCMGED